MQSKTAKTCNQWSEIDSPEVKRLKAMVSHSTNLPMTKHSDFNALYATIRSRTNETVGVSTLRRLWGYIDSYANIRNTTLDVLCRLVGIPDWHTFLADHCGQSDMQTSHRVINATVDTHALPAGARLVIEWNPNRRLVVQHEGRGGFVVEEASNSKIKEGDRFHCNRFTMAQPLYIDNLIQSDNPPTLFVVGKQGGLTRVEEIGNNGGGTIGR